MVDSTGRRRFLELAGTGTALSIAGCNALQTDTGTTADGSPDTSGETSDGKTATVQVQPDQEKLRQQQVEVRTQLQNGDLSRQEAQREMQRIQEELLTEVADSFESRISDESTLSIDDSIDQFGVFLVSGSPGTLIDSLSYEEVGAMYAQETFEQAKAQSGQQSGTPTQ